MSPSLRTELRRRSFPPELACYIRTPSAREWGRLLAGGLGLTRITTGESAPLGIEAIYRSLDRQVSRRVREGRDLLAVYAYDDGALETFRAAREHGITCIYEHPIVHWRTTRELQREEAELQPEWAPTLGSLRDSEEKLARKDEEIALADLIITPSTFSKESLSTAPTVTAEMKILPYGTGPTARPTRKESAREKLRVLFVGALTQAKGLGYLLTAATRLDSEISLTLIGRRVSPTVPAPALLEPHRWIPSLPHPQLLREIGQHDVLVLPSLHEGFGLVIAEALSQGTTVITTRNTVGPDLIEDGVEGFLVPIRSADAIEEKLLVLARDRPLLAAMQAAAEKKAVTMGWEKYRQRLAQLAREVVARSPV